MSTRWTSRGPGGRFTGGGKFGAGGDNVTIDVTVTYDDSQVTYGADGTKKTIQELGTETQKSTSHLGMSKDAADAYANSLRKSISPVRSLSWDMMLMSRSLSIVNREFLGNNEIIHKVIGVMQGIAAITRMATTAIDFYRIAVKLSAVENAASVASSNAAAASTMTLAGAKALLSGPAGIAAFIIGSALVAGVVGSYLGSLPSRKSGGYIPETGPYLLHKGETVIPSGMNFSTVNINMNTGPISSSIDVDNMLTNMARKMLLESRRRGAS